ncbi:MAG: hypothetical protein HY075_03080 [Deltaproteobacteria bacterium]|nr:hypothetical protein [Deltaproteobacteria bacterium]
MKTTLAILAGLLLASASFAQEGLLPGEPDPNTSPKSDRPKAVECPKGQKRFQKMKCGAEEDRKPPNESCELVFECRKSPKKLDCKKPKELVPFFHCFGP